MKITANLGLKKPEGTDVVNIDDLNYNADVIDTELQKRALKTDIPTVPVQSVNGKTGTVSLTAADIGAATSAQGIKADTALQSSQLGQAWGPAKQDDFMSHLADDMIHIPYVVATGSANTYAVTLNPAPTAYVDGMAVCVKINIASTGASTLNVNGLGVKTILDSLGNAITAGGLKAGVPYTLRYNGTNFIIQGKGGGGNATADKLLSGYTATVDTGQITGTMPNLSGNWQSTVYKGAYNYGSYYGVLAQIPQGYSDGGNNTYTLVGDTNFIPANIANGKTIFGVTGIYNNTILSVSGTLTSIGSINTRSTASTTPVPLTNVTVRGCSGTVRLSFQIWGSASYQYADTYTRCTTYVDGIKIGDYSSTAAGGSRTCTYDVSVHDGSVITIYGWTDYAQLVCCIGYGSISTNLCLANPPSVNATQS